MLTYLIVFILGPYGSFIFFHSIITDQKFIFTPKWFALQKHWSVHKRCLMMSDRNKAACALNLSQGPVISYLWSGKLLKDWMKSYLNFHLYILKQRASQTELGEKEEKNKLCEYLPVKYQLRMSYAWTKRKSGLKCDSRPAILIPLPFNLI